MSLVADLPLPFTKTEAEAISAFLGVLDRQGLSIVLRCGKCYMANRPDVCAMRRTSRMIRMVCRCGVREYVAATDLPRRLANTTKTSDDTGHGTIEFNTGEKSDVDVTFLTDEEAAIIRQYHRVAKALGLQPFLVHRPCWDGKTVDDSMMQTGVDDHQIRLLCKCRLWFYQGGPRLH